jgi:WD40 repeat protein
MLLMCVWSLLLSGNLPNASFSWDTRAPTEAKAKIRAHEQEILAVAFSPATEHLLVTGSADKVRCC